MLQGERGFYRAGAVPFAALINARPKGELGEQLKSVERLVHLHSWSTKLKIVRSRNFLDGKTFAELRYLVVALDELSITLL